ncbi:MAG TPA: glycosyltransferase family 39 protein [Acidimicrobiia bacterium]|nr:glycosyltransferase family 39 protein [Acidimicrobiia bacterium]
MQRDDAVGSRRYLVDGAVLAGLTALAIFTRDRPLAPHSLFLDDAWVSVGYRSHGLAQLARTTFTAPLFSFATDLWLKAVGLTSLHAQMLAFVAGVVGPAAVYLVARSMRMNRAAALVAGALLLFAPLHMEYSSRVKEYTLDALLTAAVLVVAWRTLESPTRRRVIVLTATAIVASVASLTVAPVVAGAFAALTIRAVRTRTHRVVAAIATGSYALAAGSWWALVIRPASNSPLHRYWQIEDGFWTDDHLRVRSELGLTLAHVARGFSALPPALTLALLALATIVAFAHGIERALLLVVPGATALLLSAANVAPIGGRVDIYLYPTFALLLAFAVEPLLRRRGWLVIAPIALVAVLLSVTPLPRYYPNENLEPLVASLEARAAPRDPIVIYRMSVWGFALYTRWPVRFVRSATGAVPFTADVARPDIYEVAGGRPANVVDPIEDRRRVDRIWFLGSHARLVTDDAETRTFETDGFRLVSHLGNHSAWLDEFVRAPRHAHATTTA